MSAHGTGRRYRLGCRCDECRAANTRAHQTYMRKRGVRAVEEFKAERLARSLAKHGTKTNYDRGCRCDDCREYIRVHRARARMRQRSRPVPAHVHGTVNGYQNYACRCDRCRGASSAARQKRRAS